MKEFSDKEKEYIKRLNALLGNNQALKADFDELIELEKLLLTCQKDTSYALNLSNDIYGFYKRICELNLIFANHIKEQEDNLDEVVKWLSFFAQDYVHNYKTFGYDRDIIIIR